MIRGWRVALTSLGVSISSALFASPTSGTGELAIERGSSLFAIHAPALADIGNDVIRFSTTPALGGRATVIEIHRLNDRWATGRAYLLVGHPSPSSKWQRLGDFQIDMKIDDYQRLATEVDTAMDRGDPGSVPILDNGDFLVCTDGPGYVTERRKGDHTRWISGFCGPNPNNDIAPLMANVVANVISYHLRTLNFHDFDQAAKAAQVEQSSGQ